MVYQQTKAFLKWQHFVNDIRLAFQWTKFRVGLLIVSYKMIHCVFMTIILLETLNKLQFYQIIFSVLALVVLVHMHS